MTRGIPRPWTLAARGLTGVLAVSLLQAPPLANASSQEPLPRASTQATESSPEETPREAVGLIVKYAPGAHVQESPGVPTGADEVTVTDIELGTRIGFGLRTVTFTETQPTSVAEVAAAQIEQDPAVISAEPDWMISVEAQPTGRVTPRTEQSGATWGIDRIDQRSGLSGTYNYETTGLGVTAYIIDTGILSTHTQFTGRMSAGYDAVLDGHGTEDCNGHGTHVAGTVGGTTYGVAKQVTLVPVRVLDCSGSGWMSDVIAGINWAIGDHGPGEAAVINMSLGGGASWWLDNAVANAVADGITVVVAAGNETDDACDYSPAGAPDAITVNASTSIDSAAWFSNYGACSDLYAPGLSITSAWYTSNTATNTISGTSMASPHVAGAAARILEAHPAWTPAQVWSAISAATTSIDFAPGGSDPNKLLYADPLDGAHPQVPTGLSVVADYESLEISWTAPEEGLTPTHYDIQHSDDTGATWTTDDTTDSTSTMLNGLDPAMSYLVRVRSATADDSSAWVTSASAQPLAPTVPDAVDSLDVVPDDDTTLHLTWSAPADTGGRPIDYYAVRHSDDDSTWVTDDTTVTDSATITGLSDDSTYYVQVAAVNALGQGAWSASSSPLAPRTLAVPTAPVGLGLTGADGAISATWSVPADEGGRSVTSYVVEYSTDDSTWSSAGSVADTSTTISGLANGTSYSVRVAAVTSVGQGAYATGSATPTAPAPSGGGGGGAGGGGGGGAPPPPAATAPGAPRLTVSTAGNRQISLEWQAPDDTGGAAIESYTLEIIGPDGAQSYVSGGTTTVITGLVNGSPYTAHVAATNSAGPGAWSEWSSTLVPAGPASAPLGLTGAAGDHSATLSWSAPADAGGSSISSYVIDIAADGHTQQLTTTDTRVVLVSLTNGLVHTVHVAAVTAVGQGEWSSPILLTPKAAPLGAPQKVMPVRTAHGVQVSWRAPETGTATRYVVAASINGAPYRRMATTTTSRVSFATSPTARMIKVRVAAIDTLGRGPWSTPVRVPKSR